MMGTTKLQIAATVLAVAIVMGCRPKQPPEAADIQMNMRMAPATQVISIYASFAKEKIRVPVGMVNPRTVRIFTPRPMTRTEAIALIEASLLEQAHIKITRAADGTLVGIPQDRRGDGGPMTTFFPDGRVDPPFPHPGPRITPTQLVPKPQQ